MPNNLRKFSEEEIEVLLSGDKREVDRFLLHGISQIAGVMVPHIEKEEAIFDALGDIPTIRTRSEWIEAQIAKQKRRNDMMQKVTESALIWVAILFLAFLAYSVFDHVVEVIRVKLNTPMVMKP